MKERFSRFLVARSRVILIIFVLLALGCAALIPQVNINQDMTKYLPKDSAMRHGLDLMRTEFGSEESSTLEVMFDDLKTAEEKDGVLRQLEAIRNVESVDYEAGSEDEDQYYNKGQYTRYIINCDCDQYSKKATGIWNDVTDAFGADHDIQMSGPVNDANYSGLPPWIVIVAVLLIIVILIVMASSWIDPAAFLITIGIAVLINMGTYVFFPSISKTTYTIVALLQLALSMDYSIMLMNRYRQQRQHIPDKNAAMESALNLSFGAVTGSSLTTFAGLLALLFMSYSMGADIGLSLAKAVIISLVCIFTVLPALILGFDSLMARTAKRTLPFDHPKLAGFQYRMRIPLTMLFAALLIGSFMVRSGVDFSYTQGRDVSIEEVFGHTNTIVLMYDEKDAGKAGELADMLDEDKDVRSALCYESTLGKQRDTADMRSFIEDMKDEDSNMDSEDLNLSESMIRLIYYDYHNGGADFTMTVSQFVSFLRGEVMSDPDFGDTIDQGMKDEIDDMAKFTDAGTLTTRKSAAGLADFFGMKESQARQLLLYYQIKNKKTGKSMNLPDFVSFLINTVASDKDYGRMISKSQLAQLKSMQVYTDKDRVTADLTYKENAQLLGMDENQMRLIYVYKHASSGVSSKMTISGLAGVLSSMSEDPALKDRFGGQETAQLIGGLQQVGQMDTASYAVSDMVNALEGYGMPLDTQTLTLAYSYSDISGSDSAFRTSAQKTVDYMLADKNISGSLTSDQKEQLKTLKGIIDASVSGKKLSAKTMASILGMKSSDVNSIYLFRQYKKGDTGSWKLTPQQFVNFLVNKVLADKSMSSRIGNNAADLRKAQKLINAAADGRQFSSDELTSFLDDLGGSIEADEMSMLYELFGSRNYYDEEWTMDVMQMVTHLDENMAGRAAFRDAMTQEQKDDLHTMREDMDEAAELLKGKHYGRMMITATLPEDSDETRAFINELTEWTGDNFGQESYMIGNSPMAWEMSQSFKGELNKITLITALFILLIVLMTFRRLAAPIILVLIIQCAVFMTMGLLNFLHMDMYYLALLIVQSIMMGATIDYAIIYTTYYIEKRTLMNPREAIREAYKGSLQTIMTSALILTLEVGLLSFAFKEPATQQICRILSVGCLIATLLVIFVLPGILSCLDRFVAPKKNGS